MGIVQKDSIKITAISYLGAVIGVVNKMLLFPMFFQTDQVGLANLLASVAVLYASLAQLGTHNVLLRYLPVLKHRDQPIGGFMWWLTWVVTGGFLFITALLFIFQAPVTAFYARNSQMLVDYFHYLVPFGAVTLYFFFFDGYLRALYKTVVPVLFYEVFLRIFITMTIGIYATGWLDFDQFVLIYLVAHCLPTLIILVYTAWLGRLHLRPEKLVLEPGEKREIILYGTFSFFNTSSSVLMATLDSLLVAGMLGLDKTGIYTTLFFFASLLMVPYRAIVKIAGPVVADNWRRNDLTAMDKLYKQVTSSNIVIGCILFAFIWMNMDVAFAFMPPEYATGRYAFFFLAMGRLFDMFTGINGLILVTSEKYKFDLLFSIMLIVLLASLTPLFIYFFDMEGAAIGTSLAITIYNLSRLIYLRQQYGIHPIQWRALLLLPLTAIPIALNEWVVLDWGLIPLTILKTGVLAGYFLAILYLLRPVEEINRVMSRIAHRIQGKRI